MHLVSISVASSLLFSAGEIEVYFAPQLTFHVLERWKSSTSDAVEDSRLNLAAHFFCLLS
jgi:hypothetical protein